MSAWQKKSALIGAGLLLACSTIDFATAGWPFKKSSDCCTPEVTVCNDCPPPVKKRKELKDPPDGPVVSSIPALMLPQMAVAVPPQRLNAMASSADNDRAERLLKMLERLEARQGAAATATATKTPEERLEELLDELRLLKTELEEVKRTNGGK